MSKPREPKQEAPKLSSTMEFIMTYSWAILVVLVLIGALAYFTTSSHKRFLAKDNCQIVEYKEVLPPYTCNQMAQALLLEINLPQVKVMKNKICHNLNITTNITKDISYGGYGMLNIKKLFLEECILKFK